MAHAVCLSSLVCYNCSAPPINYFASLIPQTASTYPGRYQAGVAIDSADTLWIAGGQDTRGNMYNDVWQSSDLGASWVCQSCKNPAPTAANTFAPRYDAALVMQGTSKLYLIGGFDGTNFFNEISASTDAGVTWSTIAASTTAGFQGTPGPAFAWWTSDASVLVVIFGTHLWTVAAGFTTFVDQGALTFGGQAVIRYQYGAQFIPSTGWLVIAGGYLAGSSATTDVWASQITGAGATLNAFTLMTAAAPWSKRSMPGMSLDSQSNVILYGQYPASFTDPNLGDVIWSSADHGLNWVRLDSATTDPDSPDCALAYPYPSWSNPGDYQTIVDSSDRLVVFAGGFTYSNPTTNMATAIVQLRSTPERVAADEAAGLVAYSICTGGEGSTGAVAPTGAPGPGPGPAPVVGDSSSAGGGGATGTTGTAGGDEPTHSGLSTGAKFAIVIVIALVIGAAVGAYIYWTPLKLLWKTGMKKVRGDQSQYGLMG